MLLSATENCCLHLLVQGPSVLLSPRYWAFFSTSLNRIFTQRAGNIIPHHTTICLPFFLLLFSFLLPSLPTSLRLADGAPPAHGPSCSLQQYLLNFLGSYLAASPFVFQDLADHSLGVSLLHHTPALLCGEDKPANTMTGNTTVGREQPDPRPSGVYEEVSHNFHLLKFISSNAGSSWMLHIFEKLKAT